MNPALTRQLPRLCRYSCDVHRVQARGVLVPSILFSRHRTKHWSRPRNKQSRSYATKVIGASSAEHEIEPVKPSPARLDISNAISSLERVKVDVKRICLSSSLPEEKTVLEVLITGKRLAEAITQGQFVKSRIKSTPEQTIPAARSTLPARLDESSTRVEKDATSTTIGFRLRASDVLGENLRDLLCDPKVYISSDILRLYVRVQNTLNKAEHIPEIFYLYAHKPIPVPSTTTPTDPKLSAPDAPSFTFKRPWTWSPRNAIPLDLVEETLSTTIAMRSLPLSLSVIDTSVGTQAFRINKVLRKASIPLFGISMFPLIAYSIGHWFGHHYQITADPNYATIMCTLGVMAYLGVSTSLGMTALLTYNDQMERVTWRMGTRLRDRWLREEERAAFDQLALAWGFREKFRWGEERGEDWEALREFCSRRHMILDNTTLLQGMK